MPRSRTEPDEIDGKAVLNARPMLCGPGKTTGEVEKVSRYSSTLLPPPV